MGQQDGTADGRACHQTWQPEFYPWEPQGKRELAPSHCPLTPHKHTVAHTEPPTQNTWRF